ncbi:MAG: DUF6737 family protein [Synechococcus sp.]|nr:DUF6737 family protein [Synechococcus sp.]
MNSLKSADPSGFWSHKPWWCQPWSILATGAGLLTLPWLLFHRLWISVPIAVGVIGWWILFLVIVPAAHHREQP